MPKGIAKQGFGVDHTTAEVWSRETDALSSAELVLIAKAMVAARKSLHGPLASDLIHDPALDLLLRAYIADVEQEPLGLGALLASTTVALTVGRRWVTVLASRDMLAEDSGAVRLTERGRSTMEETLRAVSRSQAAI